MDRKKLKDEVWLRVAYEIARLHTCARRAVGAVILDSRGVIVATGYNGVASGVPHCTDKKCAGADCPSGTGLDLCEAIHAEQNALKELKDATTPHTMYSTTSPCIHCVKMWAGTSLQRIVFSEEYPHSTSGPYWKSLGRSWEHVPIQPPTNQEKEAQKGFLRRWWEFLCRKIHFLIPG